MMQGLGRLRDRLLGRGEAAITVPVFDGALKPNRLLEDAEVFVGDLSSPEDIATDGESLFVADGGRVLRIGADGDRHELICLPAQISALACVGGGIAVAMNGSEVCVIGGALDGRRWTAVEGVPLHAVNALAVTPDGGLLATEGSREHSWTEWKRDLMTHGRSGRALALDPGADDGQVLARRLAYPFGACPIGDVLWLSESWRHRLLRIDPAGKALPLLEGLPAYPSRLSPAGGDGAWLTAFLPRSQLVEFVLREHGYRRRMLAEIAPEYWIAPALSSGRSFLEPMQGAQLKVMGVVKPWAPPRAYGLLIRLDAAGQPRYSLHSRFDGRHHGIVAAVEFSGRLHILSKGSRCVLRMDVSRFEQELRQ